MVEFSEARPTAVPRAIRISHCTASSSLELMFDIVLRKAAHQRAPGAGCVWNSGLGSCNLLSGFYIDTTVRVNCNERVLRSALEMREAQLRMDL